MRKITLIMFTLLICAAQQVKAQTDSMLIRPTVDKRVELLSIVFRLTGNPEYSKNDFKLYTDRIESHFSPYKNHELILFVRSLVKTDGVSYDAVMSMAVNLDDQFNLPEDYGSLDSRWNRNQVGSFIKLLKKFVKDSRFDAFYHSNENLYKEAVNRFMPIYKNIDINGIMTSMARSPTTGFTLYFQWATVREIMDRVSLTRKTYIMSFQSWEHGLPIP